eukprot:1159578-Pelagomonas_calceolata.AAC.2
MQQARKQWMPQLMPWPWYAMGAVSILRNLKRCLKPVFLSARAAAGAHVPSVTKALVMLEDACQLVSTVTRVRLG